MKENDREQELTAEKKVVKKIVKERPLPGKKGDEIVLNTEQCRELNRVRARELR